MDKVGNDVQEFIAEVNSIGLLMQYLKIAIATVLEAHEELAVKIVDRNDERFPLYLPSTVCNQDKNFPVILIGGWFTPKGDTPNSYFNGYQKWETFRTIDKAIAYIIAQLALNEAIWQNEFKEKFGDGYNSMFMRHDGTVEIGYKVQSCHSFPEYLAISLVHFYYGR